MIPLKQRVDLRDNDTKVVVKPDPEKPACQLLYRYVRLTENVSTDKPFADCEYFAVLPLRKGEVLELKEDGEESVLKPLDNYHPKFKLHVRIKHGVTEISFSTNPGLSLSRIMLEDPQKRVYSLGTSGTLDEKNVWYLPADAAFSKNAESSSWHIKLDRYSCCIYEYVIE